MKSRLLAPTSSVQGDPKEHKDELSPDHLGESILGGSSSLPTLSKVSSTLSVSERPRMMRRGHDDEPRTDQRLRRAS